MSDLLQQRSALGGALHPDTFVVVPMHNEAQVIAEVVTELRHYFANVICVDDGSRDACGALATAAGARVVRHTTNLGQGAAIQTGLEYSLRDPAMRYVVTFDADGQHRAGDADAMLRVARESDADMVLGSRFLRSNGSDSMPVRRRVLLRGAIAMTRLTTRLPLTDSHNGLRVMTRRTAELLDIRLNGMAHASEVLHTLAHHKLSFVEFPVSVQYTEYSMSKGQSSINAFNIAFDLLMNRVRVAR